MIIKDKKKLIRQLIIGTFTLIPFLSSTISAIHLVNLFNLGNQNWMSIMLSIAFEAGSIASLLILTILDKINKRMVMSIFVILVMFQILGNVFYSFDYINQQLKINPNWLGSFQELIGYFVQGDIVLTKMIVSVLVGGIIPLIALFFLKSLVDYLKFEEENPKENINSTILETPQNLPELNITIEPEVVEVPEIKIEPEQVIEEPEIVPEIELTPEEMKILIEPKLAEFVESQTDVPAEYIDIVNENFWDLVPDPPTIQEEPIRIKSDVQVPGSGLAEIDIQPATNKETTIVAPGNPAIFQNNNLK